MNNLPQDVEKNVDIFVDATKNSFGVDLVSIILFGSAASGELRATSDVNILLVLKRFDQTSADQLREPMRLAHATVQINVMFLLESEVPTAVDAFAVKFSDIISRHRLLFGTDPFADLRVTPESLLRRVKQVLLNLQLRLRERYVSLSLREEQLAHLIADSAPPLRSSAASILQLEGNTEPTAKLALEHIVHDLRAPEFQSTLQHMSDAREKGQLPAGVAVPTLMSLIQLTQHLRNRADQIQ